MQSILKQKTWIILAFFLGAILVLVLGYLIGNTVFTGDSSGESIGDVPRNPPTTGSVAIQAFSLEPDRIQAGIFRYRLDASNSNGQFFNWSELQLIVE